jgi:hypothetical protein
MNSTVSPPAGAEGASNRFRSRIPAPGRLLLVGLACAALLLGVSGGVEAAGLITGQRIADGSVTSKDLRDGRAVKTADVRNGTLTRADFPGATRGDQGPPGDQGPQGDVGAPGQPAFRGTTQVVSPAGVDVPPGEDGVVVAACPTGTRVISGGVASLPTTDVMAVRVSEPVTGGTGWASVVHNESGDLTFTAFGWAVCTPTP